MTCVAILLIEMAVLAQIGAPSPVSTMIDPPSPPEQSKSTVQYQSPPWPFVLSSLLVVGTAIPMGIFPSRTESVPERNSFTSFSLQTNEWQARRARIPEVLLSGLKLSDYLLVDFNRPEVNPVNLYVAYYENQRKGQSPHSPRVCIPGGGWQIDTLERMRLDAGLENGKLLHFNRVVIKRGEDRQLVYYWFQQRGRLIANEYLAKWYLFRDALVYNRTDGALVRLVTPVAAAADLASADARLTEFAVKVVHALEAYVPA
jgi:EpsI family protein